MVFTCVTDTGRLVWEIINENNRHVFHSPAQINISISLDIFTLTLLSVTNNSTFRSTAVAHNISVDYNGTKVSCSDFHILINSQQLMRTIIGKESDIHRNCNSLYAILYLLHT